MPHFLINSKNIARDSILIDDPKVLVHLTASLRIKIGENIKLIDENQVVHLCKVEKISKNEIAAKILQSEKSDRFLPYKLNLIQSVLKPDAQNLAVSNAVQLGVNEFHPVISDNSTVKLSLAKVKTEKWQKIADETFKQCERATIMKVMKTETLSETLKNTKNLIVFAEKNTNTTLRDVIKEFGKNAEINVLIGPEGGFSQKEFEFFLENNLPLVSLGNLILKAPNAITSGLSIINYEINEQMSSGMRVC